MSQLIRNTASRTNRHARYVLAAVRECGVARLFNMHRAGRGRPVAVRLRSTVGRHEADRFVYRSTND